MAIGEIEICLLSEDMVIQICSFHVIFNLTPFLALCILRLACAKDKLSLSHAQLNFAVIIFCTLVLPSCFPDCCLYRAFWWRQLFLFFFLSLSQCIQGNIGLEETSGGFRAYSFLQRRVSMYLNHPRYALSHLLKSSIKENSTTFIGVSLYSHFQL